MADLNCSKEYLHELFEYKDGNLYWKKIGGRRRSNKPAGTVVKNKYIQIRHGENKFLAHRAIFMMFNGYLPEYIDHIDGNGFNNNINNLREATRAQNSMNSKIRKDSTTGVKGVGYCKKCKKWFGRVTVDGKSNSLGYFDTIENAEKAVKSARNLLHGEYSRHY